MKQTKQTNLYYVIAAFLLVIIILLIVLLIIFFRTPTQTQTASPDSKPISQVNYQQPKVVSNPYYNYVYWLDPYYWRGGRDNRYDYSYDRHHGGSSNRSTITIHNQPTPTPTSSPLRVHSRQRADRPAPTQPAPTQPAPTQPAPTHPPAPTMAPTPTMAPAPVPS